MSAAACGPTTRLGATMSPSQDAAEHEPKGCSAGGVHPQLWQECAGSMCAVPPVGAAVYYFPQGHAEQAAGVDLRVPVPPFVPCRVTGVRLMAEPDTDDVFAKIRLVPLHPMEPVVDVVVPRHSRRPRPLSSFAKTLTQSDARDGSSFSVPKSCALNIFPELDYSLDPPVQFFTAKDVHRVDWTFRHIYRGTPHRHLLSTGWSSFLNRSKKLLPGDSVVFIRDENDDGSSKVHIGLRRATRVFGNAGPSSVGKVPAEDVVKAARLASAGMPFEVVQYPRASAGDFYVRADAVKESLHVPWCPGLRFKMAFEMEDVSKISWFMGTVAGVDAADPARWPHSPWRLLQVTWDEPDLLTNRNVNRVCPWLVELVSSMPNLPHFSPPLPPPSRRTESHSECRLLFNPLLPLPLALALALELATPHPTTAPMLFRGMRHRRHAGHQTPPAPRIATDLRIGSRTPRSPSPAAKKRDDDVKPPAGIMLFGRAILTEEQMMKSSNGSSSSVPTSPRATRSGGGSSNPDCDDEKASDRSGSDGNGTYGSPPHPPAAAKKNSLSAWRLWWSAGDSPAPASSEFGRQCKVFVESDAVGRSLDLSALGSFEELCARLSTMFGIDDKADLRSHMVYRTIAGEVKHVGDEPFSAFVQSTRRITVLSDAGSDNTGS